ncbi:MAG TPA: GTP 3',8-cyclase MoaA, partial [Actinobacteria bacterium]|nr:GTP 3',8-cyclase MoaA [Actinomycetota bacterium]
GSLYMCLFAADGTDLRAALRSGATVDDLVELISSLWATRDDRYSEIRSSRTNDLTKVEMSYIGG